MQTVMFMRRTDLIVPIDLTVPTAAIVPTDQVHMEAMHLILQAVTAAMAPTAIIVPTLQEAMFQVGQALIPQVVQLQ